MFLRIYFYFNNKVLAGWEGAATTAGIVSQRETENQLNKWILIPIS